MFDAAKNTNAMTHKTNTTVESAKVTDAPSFSTGTDGDASLLAKGSDDSWDDDKPEDFGIGTEEEKQYRASTKETLDSIYDDQKKMADSSSKPARREPPKLDWNRVNKDVRDMLSVIDATTLDTKENRQCEPGCNRCRQIMDDYAQLLAQMAKERSVLIESNALLRENNRLLKENLELKEEALGLPSPTGN